MTPRPGFKTTEFLVTLLTLLGSVISAAEGYISDSNGVKLSVAGAVAFILSRGLAKYEQRGPGAGT